MANLLIYSFCAFIIFCVMIGLYYTIKPIYKESGLLIPKMISIILFAGFISYYKAVTINGNLFNISAFIIDLMFASAYWLVFVLINGGLFSAVYDHIENKKYSAFIIILLASAQVVPLAIFGLKHYFDSSRDEFILLYPMWILSVLYASKLIWTEKD